MQSRRLTRWRIIPMRRSNRSNLRWMKLTTIPIFTKHLAKILGRDRRGTLLGGSMKLCWSPLSVPWPTK